MSKFIKSTLILVIGGIITKLFSFVIRIYFIRVIGTEGIGIYSLVMPTYSLLITITSLGFPIAISALVSRGNIRGKKIVFSTLPVSLILNFLLVIFVIFASKFISINLLHNEDTYYPLMALSLVLPFISIGSILRGYFFGKQQMLPHSLSNVIEQIFKLLIVLLVLPHLCKYGLIVTICGYILISILSETMSIIIFLLFLPKNFKIETKDLKPDLGTIKDVMKIGIPSVSSRIIGNIGYFFEPIILSTVMLSKGFSSLFITNMYGIYNTYVLGLLLVPTYLQMAISTSLLPEISKNYQNLDKVKRIFNKTLIFSLILGICANAFLYLFCDEILWIVFRTHEGVTYVRFMAFFFSVFYMEAPINSTLQALGKNAFLMRTTLYGTIIRLLCLFVFAYLRLGMFALILAEIINVFVCVLINYTKLMYILKKRPC